MTCISCIIISSIISSSSGRGSSSGSICSSNNSSSSIVTISICISISSIRVSSRRPRSRPEPERRQPPRACGRARTASRRRRSPVAFVGQVGTNKVHVQYMYPNMVKLTSAGLTISSPRSPAARPRKDTRIVMVIVTIITRHTNVHDNRNRNTNNEHAANTS